MGYKDANENLLEPAKFHNMDNEATKKQGYNLQLDEQSFKDSDNLYDESSQDNIEFYDSQKHDKNSSNQETHGSKNFLEDPSQRTFAYQESQDSQREKFIKEIYAMLYKSGKFKLLYGKYRREQR